MISVLAVGANMQAASHNYRTTLATAIHEATALVGGTADSDALPPPREDMVLVELLTEGGDGWDPPAYMLWPPMRMDTGIDQVWVIRLGGDSEARSWEADTIGLKLFFPGGYPTPNLESRSIRIPAVAEEFRKWWIPNAHGNSREWYIPNNEANIWPFE